MSFAAIIGTLVGDILVLLLGTAAFSLLVREYRQRRQPHLLYFGAAMLFLALSFGLLSLGQTLVYDQLSVLPGLYGGFRIVLCLYLAALVFGLVESYAPKIRLHLFAATTLSLALLLWFSRNSGCSQTMIDGVSFCDIGMIGRSPVFAAFLVVLVLLVLLPGRARLRSRRQPLLSRPDALLMWAGICGLLFVYTISTAAVLRNSAVILLSLLPIYGHIFLTFLGATVKNNPDRSVVERPVNYIRRSLTFKASLIVVMMFWLLGLVMTAVTTIFFARVLQQKSMDRISHSVSILADDLMDRQDLLLQEASLVASSDISLADLSSGLTNDAVNELVQNYRYRGSRVFLRFTDRICNTVYSSRSDADIGRTPCSPGNVVARAIDGYKAAALEEDRLADRVFLRAAVPIVFEEGSGGVLVLDTEYLPGNLLAYDHAEYSAYGLLSEFGEVVLSVGRAPDQADLQAAKRAFSRDVPSLAHSVEGSIVGSKPIFDNEGLPRGWVYVSLTAADLGAYLMRTILLIILMNLLALLVMTLTVVLAIRSMLRPIRELRNAARSMASEDRAKPVVYESLDELGEMASSFNKMSATIADRTTRLRRALREQIDALVHTANGIILPLNVLRWTTDLLRFGDTGRLNKQQLELVEQMHQTNQRLYGLVQNFLEAARIDQGKLAANSAAFPAEEVIDQAAGMVAIKARHKKIDLSWERPKRPLPLVWADRVHLTKVLLHLLTNAIKYTGESGRVSIAAAATDRQSPDGPVGHFLEIAVSDTGRGIAPEEMDRIFERFFRSASLAMEDIEGTGLGLYIVRGLVELNGGRIRVESRLGSGTVFRFTLPLAEAGREN